jgi:peptidoglycan/LPS O-acetylase OafA/YrhL
MAQCLLPFAHPSFHAYLNAPSWSISCEFFFYLLAPFAISWFGRIRKPLAASIPIVGYVTAVALYLYGTTPDPQPSYFPYYFAPTRFIEFLTGVLAGYSYLRKPESIASCRTTPLIVVGVSLLGAGAFLQMVHPWPFQYAVNSLPGAALLIYVLARGQGCVTMHLSVPTMELLGMASYSFYLIHMPVIRCVRGVFRHFHYLAPAPHIVVLSILGTFFLAQASALALFRLYEMPLHLSLKGFGRRFSETR